MKLFKALISGILLMVVSPSSAEESLTPLFPLDTRGTDWTLSSLFALDTRNPDDGTRSTVFTLDTRGPLEPHTSVFTLDTRGLDPFRAPTNLFLIPEQLTVLRATWEYYGSPLGFVVARRPPLGDWTHTTVSGGSVRSWSDTTVLAGHYYEYRVAALLTNGVSDYSDIARTQMPAPPNAPQSLEAVLTAGRDVALSWEDRSHNEVGFDVWRRVGPSGTWASLALLNANVTGYVDYATSPATLYTYKLRSFNQWGYSAFSKEAGVSTPSTGGGDCGFEIVMGGANLRLDDAAVGMNEMNDVASRALLQGSLSAWVSSPSGDAHPIRVVLGFRDSLGRAVGEPVELTDFTCIPGCPAVSIEANIPASFRAPETGTNTLWLELIMSHRDPVSEFITQRHTRESPTRKRLFDVHVRSTTWPPEIKVRVIDGKATEGSVIEVPVQMVSAGGEYMVAFSVTFDEGLHWVGAAVGEDAPQAWLQSTEPMSNTVGFVLMTPLENPLADGSKQLLTLTFDAEQAGAQTVRFQDNPVARAIAGGNASTAVISWQEGLITVAASDPIEGDVWPRPHGDGVVDEQDVRLALLFALGMQDPPTETSEFQRLDCAPADTCGNGVIDIADVAAIMAYANGSLESKIACGPTSPVLQRIAPSERGRGMMSTASRTLSVDAPSDVQRGHSFLAPIVLDAQGDVHGLSMSMTFDASVLAYQEMRLIGAATNGHFLPNMERATEGILGFGLMLPQGETFATGTQTVAELTFMALEGPGIATSVLAFAQSPSETTMVDVNAQTLESTFIDTEVITYDAISASAPYPPTNGKAQALSMSQIKLSWASAPFSTGYRIRRLMKGETGWSVLAELDGKRTAMVDDGLPAGAECEYLITSVNPNGEESLALHLNARTWTELEHWRMHCFGQIKNEGIAADHEDPDLDGIPNRLEYQLGTDPLVPDNRPFVVGLEEIFAGNQSLIISYSISNNAPGQVLFEGINDLSDTNVWTPSPLSPVTRKRQAGTEEIKKRLPSPASTNRVMFFRMKAH